jgi:hypothetical protein
MANNLILLDLSTRYSPVQYKIKIKNPSEIKYIIPRLPLHDVLDEGIVARIGKERGAKIFDMLFEVLEKNISDQEKYTILMHFQNSFIEHNSNDLLQLLA